MSFAFGARTTLDAVSLEVPAGTFFALLGASGSGKTTLLKLIGGYLTPRAGSIHLAGRDLTPVPPERRQVGMVFQSYALFPHLSARENVTFGLEMRGVGKAERRRRVEEALDRVALAAEARDRGPGGLSGGQQQRVALARALVIEPHLLLLDEPLANLDRRLREQVRGELRELQRRTGVTTLLVTHDQDEALALADYVGVMAAGQLLQVGPPREVYERPVCPYVARLLGEANLIEGGTVMIRPERIEIVEHSSSTPARVIDVTYQGTRLLVQLQVADGHLLAAVGTHHRLERGQPVFLHIPPHALHRLPQRDPPGIVA